MKKSANDYDNLFKIILVGSSGSGKSCILLKYCDDVFEHRFISTIGVDFKIRTLKLKDKNTNRMKKIKLQVWDTAGQERFKTIVSTYYRGTHGCFLVYDVTDPLSFEAMKVSHQEVLAELPDQGDNTVIVLLGNKTDLKGNRMVTYETGQTYANANNILFFETSAKTGKNVEDAFNSMIYEFLENQEKMTSNRMKDPLTKNALHSLSIEEEKNCNCW